MLTLVCLVCIAGAAEVQAFEYLNAIPEQIDFVSELSMKLGSIPDHVVDTRGEGKFDFMKFFAICALLGLSSHLRAEP